MAKKPDLYILGVWHLSQPWLNMMRPMRDELSSERVITGFARLQVETNAFIWESIASSMYYGNRSLSVQPLDSHDTERIPRRPKATFILSSSAPSPSYICNGERRVIIWNGASPSSRPRLPPCHAFGSDASVNDYNFAKELIQLRKYGGHDSTW